MQPIALLAIVGVAVAGLGIGFLNNDIELTGMVQQFGVGEATIGSPISAAYIDFKIEKTRGQIAIGGENVKLFKNIISECLVQADKQIVPGSKITCKLTDINSNIAIEGMKTITVTVPTKVPITIPIVFTGPGIPSNLVNNIHDVILLVEGPSALVTVP